MFAIEEKRKALDSSVRKMLEKIGQNVFYGAVTQPFSAIKVAERAQFKKRQISKFSKCSLHIDINRSASPSR